MGTTVDERVVEMKFDNAQFERNVRQSRASLEGLKQSLNFSDSGKSLKILQNETKSFKMDNMCNAADAVRVKLSAMQVAGITAMSKITEAGIVAGKKIVSAFLRVNEVQAGWQEYGLKMNSIQTMLMSTGESLEVVNGYLDELNTYSDRTIYSFSDMTDNIGKFTTQGVKLKDAVDAIKGISNEAAISGANAQQASHAMYNFAQALSAGYVKLIDWKSIENAQMATVEFKNTLLETATALGTVKKQGDMYVSTTKNAKGATSDAFNALHNWNDNLNFQWLTNDVLIQSLKKYTDETTELGKKAYKAASEFKTFGQMWDAWKESSGSGWAQTFETIIGNFDEAKKLWGLLDGLIGDYIVASANARNETLKGWKDAGGRIDLLESFVNVAEACVKILKAVHKGFSDVFPKATAKDLVSITKAFDKFTAKLIISDKNAENLANTVRGLATILKLVSDITGAGLSIALNLAGKLFGFTCDSVLDLTGELGSNVYALGRTIDKYKIFSKIASTVNKGINGTIDTIKKGYNTITNWGPVKSTIEFMDKLFVDCSEHIGEFGEDAIKIFSDLFDKIKSGEGITLDDLVKSFKDLGTAASTSFKVANEGISKMNAGINNFKNNANMNPTFAQIKKSAIDVTGIISDLGKAIKTFLGDRSGNIKAGNIMAILLGGVSIKTLWETSKLIQVLTTGLGGLFQLPMRFGNALISFVTESSKTLQAVQSKLKADIFLDIAKAIGILAASLVVLALIPADQLQNAAICLGLVTVALAALSKALTSTNKIGESVSGVKSTAAVMLTIAGSVLILVLALKQLSKVNMDNVMGPLIILTGMVAGLTAVAIELGKADFSKASSKGALEILALAVALKLVCSAFVKLAKFEVGIGKAIGTTVLIGVLMGYLAGLMIAMGHANSVAGDIKGALALIAAAITLKMVVKTFQDICAIDVETIKGKLGVIAGVLGMFTYVMLLSKHSGTNAAKAGVLLLATTVSISLLVSVIKKIAEIPDDDLKRGKSVINQFMIIMGLVVAVSNYAGSNAAKAGMMLMQMSGAIAILSVAITILSTLDPEGLKNATIAIDSMIVCMTLLVAVTSIAKEAKKSLILCTAVMVAMGVMLALMSTIKPGNLKGAADAMAELMLCFTLMVGVSSLFNKGLNVNLLIGVAAVGALALIIWGLSKLPVESVKTICDGLSDVMLKLSAAIAIISLIPFPAALGGLASFAIFVAGLTAILAALGGLNKISGFEELISSGSGILGKIGEAIGNFVGSIVSAFAEAATDSMPEVASNLSDFMTNLKPFFKGIKTMPDGMLESTAILVASLLLMTGAGIVDNIASFFNFGKSPLSSFAEEMVEFGKQFAKYADEIKDVNPNTVVATSKAAETIVTLANSLPDSGGIKQLITGSKDLGKFAKSLIPFGVAFATYSATVKFVDPDVVTASSTAAKTISEFANTLPDSGGLKQLWEGSKSLSSFALQLLVFGPAFAAYSKTIEGVKTEAVTASSTAAKSISAFANSLPESGGLKQLFTGSQDLINFAKQLIVFGPAFKQYADTVSGIENIDVVTASTKAAESIGKFASLVPSYGGLKVIFDGSNSLSLFGMDLCAFAKHFKKYADEVSGISNLSTVEDTTALVSSLVTVANNAPAIGGIKTLWEGKKDMATFGENLKEFGMYMVDFSDEIAGASNLDKIGNVSTALKTVLELVNQVQDDTAKKAEDLSFAFGDLADISLRAVQDAFNTEKDEFAATGTKIVNWVIEGIKDTDIDSSAAGDAGKALATTVATAFSDEEGSLSKKMKKTMKNCLFDMKEAITGYKDNFKNAGSGVVLYGFVPGLKSQNEIIKMAGENAANGFIKGAYNKDMRDKAYDAGSKVASAYEDGVKKTLDEHSPSKKTKKDGAYASEGFILGSDSKLPDVRGAGKSVGNEYNKALTDAISSSTGYNVDDAISSMRDYIKDAKKNGYDTGKAASDGYSEGSSGIKKTATDTSAAVTSSTKVTTSSVKKASTSVAKTTKETLVKVTKSALTLKQIFKNAFKFKDMKKGFTASTKAAKAYFNIYNKVDKKSKNYAKNMAKSKKAINEFAKALYKESDQYKEDTKTVKEHEKALAKLWKTREKLQKSKKSSKISDLNSNAKEIKKAQKQLVDDQKTIQKNIKAALTEFRKGIKESISEYMKLSNISLDTGISMFEEFSDTTDLTVEQLLKNMESQVNGVGSISKELEKLTRKGFSDKVIAALKEMGPEAASYIKLFGQMTYSQISQTNKMFEKSAKITKDQIKQQYKDKYKDALEWKNTMVKLASKGLNKDILKEIADEGVSGLDTAKAFLSMSDQDIQKVNEYYVKSLKLQDKAANEITASFSKVRKKTAKIIDASTKSAKKVIKEGKVMSLEEAKAARKAADQAQKAMQKVKDQLDEIDAVSSELTETVKSNLTDFFSVTKLTMDTGISMFEEFKYTDGWWPSDLIRNMKSQVEGVTNLATNLDKLVSMGFSENFVKYLKSLGTSGAQYVTAFLDSTQEEINQINNLYDQMQQMSKDKLLQSAQDNLEAVKKWKKDIKTLASMNLDPGILKELIEQGMNGTDIVSAYATMSPEEIQEMNDYYKETLKLDDSVSKYVSQTYKDSATDAVRAYNSGIVDALTGKSSKDGKGKHVSKGTSAITDAALRAIKNSTNEGRGKLKDSGKAVATIMASGISSGTKDVEKSAKKVTNKAKNTVDKMDTSKSSTFHEKGKKATKAVSSGMIAEAPIKDLKGNAEGLANVIDISLGKGIANSGIKDRGANATSKVAAGLMSNLSEVRSAARSIANAISEEFAKISIPDIGDSADKSSKSGSYAVGVISDISSKNNTKNNKNNKTPSSNSTKTSTTGRLNNTTKSAQSVLNSVLNDLAKSGGLNSMKGQSAPSTQTYNTYTFTQTNNSPKALSQTEIYRQTRNQFSQLKGVLK